MTATKIMLIRHAEKPADDGSVTGVSEDGRNDPRDLVVKGWQRAGALVRFFAPSDGRFSHPLIAGPDAIFASGTVPHSNSLRPQHTVLPLARQLEKKLNLDHAEQDEAALVADVKRTDGIVLIAWHHQAIPEIGNLILGNTTTCPQKWDGSRFDVVWIFEPKAGTGGWSFTQVPQALLPGDSSRPM
jgi:broad specificity phosphatase PhoE